MSTPGLRLKNVRESHGFKTAKDAALAMGVPVATYTQHESATRFLPARRAAEYARFFKTTPEYLLYGRDDAAPDRVPVFDGPVIDAKVVAFMPPSPSSITAAQKLTERDGFGLHGFVAVFDLPQVSAPPPDVDGRLCVVAKPLGGRGEERMVRVVQRGSRPGLWHLLASGGGMPLIDQELLWLAPVVALVPADQRSDNPE